ncbi:MAG: alpha/beta fold hydrolase [Anaerolineaceae bacterium]|nr:alpha/beta fold hydrolase [Anaerolineaceae bacterium]
MMSTMTSASESTVKTEVTPLKRGCLFTLLRVAKWFSIGLVALLLSGMVYQQMAEASDRQAYTPPGQLIDIGDFRLHIHCIGEGSPTVILEAGTGGSSLDWSLVQPKIARSTRVCAYDRQGYAWSEDGTHVRTSQQVATDLHTLLANAHIEGPYILVGHSIGVIHTQTYVNQFPEDVVGMVMVDRPAAEYLTANLADDEIITNELSLKQIAAARLLNLLGIFRLAGCLSPICHDLPAELLPSYSAAANQTRYFVSVGEEMNYYPANLRYGAALPVMSSALPLVILIHAPDLGSNPNEQIYYEDRLAFASLMPNAHVVVAQGSNHFIQAQRPDLVIEAIMNVVEAIHSG